MPTSRLLASFAVSCALLTAGCSSDDGGGGGSGGATNGPVVSATTSAEFEAKMLELWCQGLTPCCAPSRRRSNDQCIASLRAGKYSLVTGAGVGEYSAESGSACLSALQALAGTCVGDAGFGRSSTFDSLPACKDVYRNANYQTKGYPETCDLDSECKPLEGATSTGCTSGYCQATADAKLGEPCGDAKVVNAIPIFVRCAAGGTCVDKICAASPSVEDACATSSSCEAGLYCEAGK